MEGEAEAEAEPLLDHLRHEEDRNCQDKRDPEAFFEISQVVAVVMVGVVVVIVVMGGVMFGVLIVVLVRLTGVIGVAEVVGAVGVTGVTRVVGLSRMAGVVAMAGVVMMSWMAGLSRTCVSGMISGLVVEVLIFIMTFMFKM
ncbi:MAG: hypothetical protein ACUVRL_02445 [Candidatus Saccharicenans sp.]|uniref:hypothetical protein n=1 Tax=Candidatus Saccharicenans sp. TaxID=2819258 RepID=UPI00404903B7